MRAAWVEFRRASDRRWLIGAFLLVALGTLSSWRDPISRQLFPDPRMNRQLERGQAALAHGKLSAADGSGARELFESVLAIDPDQMTARQGLIDVRNAAIANTERALSQHRLLESRKNLELAKSLSAPAVQLQPLRARLHDLEEASSDTSALLAQAAAPGISDEQSLVLLDQVLRLEADNAVALEGRRELLAAWLVRAENLLAAHKVADAQRLIDRVIAEDPAHLDLPPVRAELGEALSRLQAEQARVLQSARDDERAGRLDSAARKYRQALDTLGESAAAQEGLHRLASRVVRQAEKQAADFQFRQAEASLAKARRWNAGAPEIEIAEQRLAQSRQTQKRLLRVPATQDRGRLPQLLADAEQAMARGDFITPPGTSAWDKLRVAAAIAPAAPEVRKLQRDFAQRSWDCFEQALAAGQLRRAQSCLEANLAQAPTSPSAAEARQSLADRWLAYAEERIGASDYAEAEKALAFARHWQPRNPRIRATAERLRRARGSSR